MNYLLLAGLAVLLLCMVSGSQAYADIKYHLEIGSSGTRNGNLSEPTDVAYNTWDDKLYVVDSENSRINIFDSDGVHDSKFGTFCSILDINDCHDNARGADEDGDGQFDSPVAITLDGRENLFVADSDNGRIQRFDDGRFEMKFGSIHSADRDYLDSPQGVAVLDSERKIFVSSRTTDSIHVFDYSGRILFDFDSFDRRDSFSNPSHLLIDNDNEILYVSDSGKDRIAIFELVSVDTCPAGTEKVAERICFVDTFGRSGDDEGQFDSPSGLALDTSSSILYVADAGNDRIQAFELVNGSTCPAGTEKVAERICFVDTFGRSGDDEGQFDSPSGLALDTSSSILYVADAGNDRIQAFELNGAQSETLPPPENIRSMSTSRTSVVVSWDVPEKSKDADNITGYKIEYRKGSEKYEVLDEDTGNPRTMFTHTGLEPNTRYDYRVYALGSDGTSKSSEDTIRTKETVTPSGLVAEPISRNQIHLSWHAPSNTHGQSITGYEIKRAFSNGTYDTIGQTNAKTTSFVVGNKSTDRTYSFAVSAMVTLGQSDESNTATATPRDHSVDLTSFDNSYVEAANDIPDAPTRLVATSISPEQISLSWHAPVNDDGLVITGYKIQYKKGSGSFTTLVEDTQTSSRTYHHTGLSADTQYTYRVYAVSPAGISSASNQVATSTTSGPFKLNSIADLVAVEGKTVMFLAQMQGGSSNVIFSLEANPPIGARLDPATGMFSWTPGYTHGGKSYTFDIVAKKDSLMDKQAITIMVNDTIPDAQPPVVEEPPVKSPSSGSDSSENGQQPIAAFVDPGEDPHYYINRYNSEESYREWFDANYSEYASIYEAVGMEEPLEIPAAFVDPKEDPHHYIDRYNSEESYREWFDANYSEYASIYEAVGMEEPLEIPAAFVDPKEDPHHYINRYNSEESYREWFDANYSKYASIYEAVGLEEPQETESANQNADNMNIDNQKFGECGEGTELINNTCVVITEPNGGGCLVATAAYGSEIAPQVQLLREIRDNSVMGTAAGTAFMGGFNQVYYSFSPQIADYQRENPVFRDMVKVAITPLVTSLGIMSVAETEQEVLGYGIAVILINLGMYIAAPIVIIYKIIRKKNRISI